MSASSTLRVRSLLLAGTVLLTAPSIASAAVEAPETFLGLPSWVWAWANLFVLWGILFKFLGPLVRKGLAERKQAISEGLTKAEEQRVEAERMSERLEAQLQELRAEMAELVERSAEEGENERRRIVEQAEAEAARVLEQAHAEISNRTEQARGELREYAAELAAELAAEKVSERLTSDDRRRIFDENLRRLGEQIS